jgi:hypothetical protein
VKAYYLSIRGDDDAGGAIVFADTPSQAKNQIYATDIWYDGTWTDIRVCRYKKYDGMERSSSAELALKQWHDGWRWFDMDYPDVDEATDQEFLNWFKKTFGAADETSL